MSRWLSLSSALGLCIACGAIGSCVKKEAPIRFQTMTLKMGDAGAMRCNVPLEGWRDQDSPHIKAVIVAKCDSAGPLTFEVVEPEESRTIGTVPVSLEAGASRSVFTPSFALPKKRPVDVVIAVRGVCGGERVSALATCPYR